MGARTADGKWTGKEAPPLHLRAQVEWKIIEFVFKLIYLNFAL
jgi:hypothetical protein